MKEYKCILSLNLARYLLRQGIELVDIDKSTKMQGKLVFIFKNSPELQDAIGNYRKGGARNFGTSERHCQVGSHSQD